MNLQSFVNLQSEFRICTPTFLTFFTCFRFNDIPSGFHFSVRVQNYFNITFFFFATLITSDIILQLICSAFCVWYQSCSCSSNKDLFYEYIRPLYLL